MPSALCVQRFRKSSSEVLSFDGQPVMMMKWQSSCSTITCDQESGSDTDNTDNPPPPPTPHPLCPVSHTLETHSVSAGRLRWWLLYLSLNCIAADSTSQIFNFSQYSQLTPVSSHSTDPQRSTVELFKHCCAEMLQRKYPFAVRIVPVCHIYINGIH